MDTSNTSSTLATYNLTIGYSLKNKSYPIIQNASLQFEKGNLVGIIGINGSGKSTLLRTLAGLQPPLSGEIELDHNSIIKSSPLELATKLSVVLTQQAISKNLSVYELVALGRQPYTNWLGKLTSIDKEKIEEALRATETLKFKNKKCYELSDGQLQRVLIARALSQDTEVILLDEPMTHLDLHHKAALLKLLSTIAHKQHKTVLFSTHDMEYAIQVCDSLIVLQNGKAVMDTPENLINKEVFNSLFPSKYITFNTVHKRFELE